MTEKLDVAYVLEVLEQTPCTFWACDGPDKPYEHMKTCSNCALIQYLRTFT